MANGVEKQVTISQAAKLLDRKYYHVHRLVRKGRFKTAIKIGWNWLIDRAEVKQRARKFRNAR